MNTEKVFHHYGAEFNTKAAEVMVPYICELTNPSCVVDVGCGTGTWLKVFKQLGIADVKGLDGPHALKGFILDESHFLAIDFEDHRQIDQMQLSQKKYDLAICLEVAEHLTPKGGDKLVDLLTSISDAIVFSAAVPDQTGENHINEQYPDYWQERFNKKGFTFYDPFRTKFWNNNNIEWWYRQNMFLVLKNGSERTNGFKKFEGDARIHPELFNMYVKLTQNTDQAKKSTMKTILKSLLK